MPSFVTYESFPIGATIINDNARSQRYGYSGVVKGHESRSPAMPRGANRRGIVVLYTKNPNGVDILPFEQQYLCDIKQGIVVKDSIGDVVAKLEAQVAARDKVIEAQNDEIKKLQQEGSQLTKVWIEAQGALDNYKVAYSKISCDLERQHKINQGFDHICRRMQSMNLSFNKREVEEIVTSSRTGAGIIFNIDYGQAECAIAALLAKSDGCVVQDPLDKVGKFMVLGTDPKDVFHKTRRLAEQKAEELAKQDPTYVMSVVKVMSDHTANQVIQSQVKRYD